MPVPPIHSFAASSVDLRAAVLSVFPEYADHLVPEGSLSIMLPGDVWGPWPSDQMASIVGDLDRPSDPLIQAFSVPAVRVNTVMAPEILIAMADLLHLDVSSRATLPIECGASIRYWASVSRFVMDLMADQRFIATLVQRREGQLEAWWQPWLHDEDARWRTGALLTSMPPMVRAILDRHDGRPWPILAEALQAFIDAGVRKTLEEQSFFEAIEDRDPQQDPHVAWLAGLLGTKRIVQEPVDTDATLLQGAGRWVARLDEARPDQAFRLALRLYEPTAMEQSGGEWTLRFLLQNTSNPELVIEASQVWTDGAVGAQVDDPGKLLLTELGRSSRIYPQLEQALETTVPEQLTLTTSEAYTFLTEYMAVLEESGVGVLCPDWWGAPESRLGLRLQVDPLDSSADVGLGEKSKSSQGMLGLGSLVRCRWNLAIGDELLAPEEFEDLVKQGAPLVHRNGRWLSIRESDVKAARALAEAEQDLEMTALEAIRLSHGWGEDDDLPILGMDGSGWVADLFGIGGSTPIPHVEQPRGFIGTLRPYQRMGLRWLAFMGQFGLGACLADDMGLGKTIQLIALLVHERESTQKQNASEGKIGPTLLIVPTSVVGNWVRELSRFAPSLSVHVNHGPNRPTGEEFVKTVLENDVTITTYALLSRDQETVSSVDWHRVALDEAQFIKNPPTKQTQAIRSLTAQHRLALTGTPVENRLSELWSIMEFCNSGYLDRLTEFNRRFAVPIERGRDADRAEQLRMIVRPFILRRLKTDPGVADDLPECFETKEYATLTPEQVALYERVVNFMLGDIDRVEGIQRRGLVLATLVKLKQVCNHPAQFLASDSAKKITGLTPEQHGDAPVLSARSGKAARMLGLLEEAIASGGKALIFTQFRQMGQLLASMIRHDLDYESLFLHGGTPQAKRQQMIDRFQDPASDIPIFILSLKAGGLGLNLTAANHVFHFDRWWNPAVERQATDRAYRIGQTRAVHVHKFVCLGTLEERIDQMIERKEELAEGIIGGGEQWIADLTTNQLRDIFQLRDSAMEAC
ncbi:MAG: DEAD/DEAH box helicase [Phycisphaerales bacterium]|nr:DEAD/DEAH box helicase [Phycisphaerales bacterium]